jgi:hypothetical protein
MSAFLKVYTDSGHSSEVEHAADHSTTLNGSVTAGATSIVVTSASGMPVQGTIDIIDGSNNETIAYTNISSNTITLMTALAHNHASGVTINQWVYLLTVGDQTNGILNDGSNASENVGTNVGTWYVYNSGDQNAQNPVFSTSNSSPSTTSGFSDTNISITSISAGFSTSVSPSNIAAGSQQEIWVAALVPLGQSAAGNPQLCNINLSYQSV